MRSRRVNLVACRPPQNQDKMCPAARRLRVETSATMYANGMSAHAVSVALGYRSQCSVLTNARAWGVPIRARGVTLKHLAGARP